MAEFRDRTLDDLWRIVNRIPKGRVMTYGDVGRCLKNPASGFMVGRWMATCPDGVPWWRVVAKRGNLPIAKRGPQKAAEQEKLLKAEKTRFSEPGLVDMSAARWEP